MSKLIHKRISQYPNEDLQLLNGNLYCARCRQNLVNKKSTVDCHLYSMKHQTLGPSRNASVTAGPATTNTVDTNADDVSKAIETETETVDVNVKSENIICEPANVDLSCYLNDEEVSDSAASCTRSTCTCLICNFDELITDYEVESLLANQEQVTATAKHKLKKYVWSEFLVSQFDDSSGADFEDDSCFPFCVQCSMKLVNYRQLNYRLVAIQNEIESLKDELMNGLNMAYFDRKTNGRRRSSRSLGRGHGAMNINEKPRVMRLTTDDDDPVNIALKLEVDLQDETTSSNYGEDDDPDWRLEQTCDSAILNTKQNTLRTCRPETKKRKTIRNSSQRLKPCSVRLAKLLGTTTRVTENKFRKNISTKTDRSRSRKTTPQMPLRCTTKNNSNQAKKPICTFCQLQFPRTNLLWQHLKLEHGVQDRKTATAKVVGKRGRPNLTKKCEECGLVFERAILLRAHWRKAHKNNKPHQCEECGQTFRDKGAMRGHINWKHKGILRFECSVCNSKFPSKSALLSHSAQHTGIKEYGCHYCDQRFSKVNRRRQHLVQTHPEQHLKDKTVVCTTCWKNFESDSALNQHLADIHYKCQFCDKIFLASRKLRFHILMHTGEKPFQCDLCSKYFRREDNLKAHLRTHAGQPTPRPYKCHQCTDSFTRKNYLETHIRKSHPSISVPMQSQSHGGSAYASESQPPDNNPPALAFANIDNFVAPYLVPIVDVSRK